MKKLLALVLLALPGSALAGIGTTAHLTTLTDGTLWVPSLDYRASGVSVQLHLLDTLRATATGEDFALDTGVDVTYAVVKKKVAPEIEGIIAPGVGVRLANYGDFGFNLVAQTRFGMEMKQGMGFGVYVVPMAGVSNLSGKTGVVYGGGVQISAWLVNK